MDLIPATARNATWSSLQPARRKEYELPLSATHRAIIVGVDGSPVSKLAVDWAARNAAMRNTALTVVHIQESPLLANGTADPMLAPVPMLPAHLELLENHGREILDDALKTVEASTKQSGPINVNTESMTGSPVSILVDLSKNAEMVVVGGRSLGRLDRLLLGSVTTGLVHHAHCPVAIIHDKEPPIQLHPSKGPVVVGIDGSPASELATEIAFDEASRRGVELIALHACSDTALQFGDLDWSAVKSQRAELLSERLAGWQERYPDVLVSRIVAFNRPARELIEQSESAQLVVVGSHGRGGFARMVLGSVSTAVAQSAQAPVIVARRP